MILQQRYVKTIERTLAKLPFVQWDRFVEKQERIIIFGWIQREKDAYKDFVVLTFNPARMWFAITSSKEYTKKIGEILGTGHEECERAETYFKIPNVVKLK